MYLVIKYAAGLTQLEVLESIFVAYHMLCFGWNDTIEGKYILIDIKDNKMEILDPSCETGPT